MLIHYAHAYAHTPGAHTLYATHYTQPTICRYTFEGIYKANVSANPGAIEEAYIAAHAAAAKALGL
jgi:hypothetical protein